MDAWLRELRYSLRGWRRHPIAVVAATSALALATAAVTAIYSIVSGVLLRPLPYSDPERLVMVWQDMRARGGPERDWVSPGLLVEWQQRATMFERIGAVRGWQPNLTGSGDPERIRGAAASAGYFDALGVAPLMGRTFSEQDDRPGGPPVALISHGLWTRRFGGDPAIAGRTIELDGQPTEIVGVMPAWFRGAIVDAEIWAPLRINPAAAPRGMVTLRVLARLAPGITLQQASSRMTAIATELAGEDPEWERARTALVPLHADIVGDVRPMLLVLTAAVACVVLVATANLAHLLMARSADRAREMAVRAALGASRWQLLRPAAAEGLLLTATALVCGALAGWWMLGGLLAIAPASAPRLQDIRIDFDVLIVAAAATCSAALVAGLSAAAASLGGRPFQTLREGGRESTGTGRVRSAVVAIEVALSLTLVILAVLLTRTLISMQQVDLGFRPGGLLTASVQPPRSSYRDTGAVRRLLSNVLEEAARIPGVESASLTSLLPLSGSEMRLNFGIPGRPRPARPEDEPLAAIRHIGPRYFSTMGIRIVAGRETTGEDREASPRVVLVNETLARRYWPGQDPVGKTVAIEIGEATVIGVTADVCHAGPTTPASPEMYLPYTQFNVRAATLVLRTTGSPAALAGPLRDAVRRSDPNLPVAAVAPMDDLVSRSVAQARFVAVLLTGFAALATVLTVIGVYSVQAFSVACRTREIGVRMALGAGHRTVVGMVLRDSVSTVAVGLVAGLAGALVLGRLGRTLLFGVTPTDPATYAVTATLVAAAALAASYIPARHASRVDPLIALRQD